MLGGVEALEARSSESEPRGLIGEDARKEQRVPAKPEISNPNGVIETANGGGAGWGKSGIPRRELKESAPLSFGQQRVWFLNELEPGNPVYQKVFAFHLKGNFSPRIVEQALQTLVCKHEILRTVFASEKGKPMARVLAQAPVPLQAIKFRSTTAEERSKEIQRIAAEARQHRFTPGKGPLFHALLLATDEQESVLVLVMHELIADGESAHNAPRRGRRKAMTHRERVFR